MSNVQTAGPGTRRPTIVVGFDDSASSRAALGWASDWARRTGAELRAIHVVEPEWDLDTAWYPAATGWVALPPGDDALIDQRAVIADAFSNLAQGHHPVPELAFTDGPVGKALVAAARDAALLVVGTRRLHGLSRVVEGSVSHYCLSHATCPVLAVPALPPGRPADSVERTEPANESEGATV